MMLTTNFFHFICVKHCTKYTNTNILSFFLSSILKMIHMCIHTGRKINRMKTYNASEPFVGSLNAQNSNKIESGEEKSCWHTHTQAHARNRSHNEAKENNHLQNLLSGSLLQRKINNHQTVEQFAFILFGTYHGLNSTQWHLCFEVWNCVSHSLSLRVFLFFYFKTFAQHTKIYLFVEWKRK